MAYDGYRLIRFARDGKIVTATVDAPPINIITTDLYAELSRMSQDVEADTEALVFILKSANPDFFLAHFDVGAILSFPIDRPASREAAGRNDYHAMCNRMSTMDKVTIAQIEGRVGGGGSELSMNFDIRVRASSAGTIVNQMEVPLGILPGSRHREAAAPDRPQPRHRDHPGRRRHERRGRREVGLSQPRPARRPDRPLVSTPWPAVSPPSRSRR